MFFPDFTLSSFAGGPDEWLNQSDLICINRD
jgi:hypothetical protein